MYRYTIYINIHTLWKLLHTHRCTHTHTYISLKILRDCNAINLRNFAVVIALQSCVKNGLQFFTMNGKIIGLTYFNDNMNFLQRTKRPSISLSFD